MIRMTSARLLYDLDSTPDWLRFFAGIEVSTIQVMIRLQVMQFTIGFDWHRPKTSV